MWLDGVRPQNPSNGKPWSGRLPEQAEVGGFGARASRTGSREGQYTPALTTSFARFSATLFAVYFIIGCEDPIVGNSHRPARSRSARHSRLTLSTASAPS